LAGEHEQATSPVAQSAHVELDRTILQDKDILMSMACLIIEDQTDDGGRRFPDRFAATT
jgi:hypothetical protein